MPFFIFSTNKPAANNDPSVDQPDMLQNNVSTNGIINVDHYTFNDNNGGLHKQTQIVDQVNIPPGLLPGQSTLYSKFVQVHASGPESNSTVFYSPGDSGNEYQMTRAIDSQFATFGNYTNYVGPADQTGGWTFLPGGLLYQYGRRNAGDGTVITFPIPFANDLEISVVITRFNNNDRFISIKGLTNTNFTIYTNSAAVNPVFWTAVGR